ncbi:hypothetical protein [Streptomyces violaceusniger]|uniref:hypothetical protein n=1 Tax=Streptomyces violaceusniger TaxID=68280 RepID=UPI0036A3EFB8
MKRRARNRPAGVGHYCASCARPLARNTYGLCPLGCGARLCRNGQCKGQHVPRNCPTWQASRGLTEAA